MVAMVIIGVLAASASADSLVFIRDNNVWLANADGTNQYQVTLDGTPTSPYSSPSQADDGTIVALRTPAGGRPQIWRMHQNGGLVNPPINTPAPGTGALDARVSPDGQLVAYWFVTQVMPFPCLYCIELSTRVLISHVDQFTNPDDVGTPHTGSHPSWMSNDTLLLSNSNATQWYYSLGTPEAAQWWGDSDNCGCTSVVGLTDGVVSRNGQRIAVVRGDSNETIWLYKTNGAPPAVPTPECAFTGPNGHFQNPTWSSDAGTLAWQEDDGVWSAQIPSITSCGSISQPRLIVAGATEPSFGPAAINTGARPGCGNPGNPVACQTPPTPPPSNPPPSNPPPSNPPPSNPPPSNPPPSNPPPSSPSASSPAPLTPTVSGQTSKLTVSPQMRSLLTSLAHELKRMGIHGLVHQHGFSASSRSVTAGKLTATLETGSPQLVTLASGRVTFTAAGTRKLALELSQVAIKTLRHARHLNVMLRLTFTSKSGASSSTHQKVWISR
jgi:hypothetical protein